MRGCGLFEPPCFALYGPLQLPDLRLAVVKRETLDELSRCPPTSPLLVAAPTTPFTSFLSCLSLAAVCYCCLPVLL